MFLSVFVILLAACAVLRDGASAHSYGVGSCPVVEPQSGFDMNRFLGQWYVIQKTKTSSRCILYNITKQDEPDHFLLKQISHNVVLHYTPLDDNYHYTGELSVPNPAVPGSMTVKFPLNIAGSAAYTVFMTDYDSYAGVFSCQKLAFANRQSASILSRTKTLDKAALDKIRAKLASYNVDPFELSIISQEDCSPIESTEHTKLDIDPDTISTKSAVGAVKKVGEKIGDGFEYIADGAKKLYNTYIKKEEQPQTTERLMNANPDAEWLP